MPVTMPGGTADEALWRRRILRLPGVYGPQADSSMLAAAMSRRPSARRPSSWTSAPGAAPSLFTRPGSVRG
ncbi:hypothetical protein NKH18_15885 [Streptomyces sp. M10(2022)]